MFEYLLQQNRFDAPAFVADHFLQAREQFGTDARGVAGEVDQMSLAAFKNLERELVAPVEGDQRSINRLDASLVNFIIMAGTQDDRDLLRRVFAVRGVGERDVDGWEDGRIVLQTGSLQYSRFGA